MKYKILSILFAFMVLTSCIDDDLVACMEEVPEDITNGYSLNFTVTLDEMGGMRSSSGLGNPMKEIENYIDLEKFRILFFNHEDKFLFESKSRWVKKLENSDDYSRWFVSVPVFPYGNDTEDWNWDEIRKALRSKKFKIAILANRPGQDMALKFDKTGQPEEWFDNTGPHWGADDAVGGSSVKDVFDLHHSQYDPIYTNKSWPSDKDYPNNPYYGFVTEEDTYKGNKVRTMSSTSSWVNWDKISSTYNCKYSILPSEDHPIPMYGIQEFEPLQDWKEGTTFNLIRETDKPISLLRSVVKLELVIPKSANDQMKYVFVMYPNIYARCEPMNVWTPTDELWGESHSGICPDWNHLAAYGPVSRKGDSESNSTSSDYKQRMLWFYGAWREKGWFKDDSESESRFNVLTTEGFGKDTYPQIFNSCIQRNTAVLCAPDNGNDFSDDGDGYFRYIVYVGERNVNDPSNLSKMGANTSGAPTIIHWRFNLNNQEYNIPLTDYKNVSDVNEIVSNSASWDKDNKGNPTSAINSYEQAVQDMSSSLPKPWPLIRNHVYQITLAKTDEMSYHWDFNTFGYKTQNDITAATNWSNPGGGETKVLSYSNLISDTNKPGQNVTINWWDGDGSTTLAQGSFGSESHNINGYTPIKIGSGKQVTLTVPNKKTIKELTLRSYIDVKDYVDAKKALEWAVNSAPRAATKYYLKTNTNSGSYDTNSNDYVLQFAFGSMDPSKSDASTGWSTSTLNKNNYLIVNSKEFGTYATTTATNGNASSSLAADGSSQGNYVAFVPKHSGKLIIVVQNMGSSGKNVYLYENGIQKEAILIGTDSNKKNIKFNGNDDIYKLNGNSVYEGGIQVEVEAGYTYTISASGSKGRWMGFIYDYEIIPETDQYYWAEVAGTQYEDENKKGMSHFYGQTYYDEYLFENINANKVTFTNSNNGGDICFVASVKTENANGLPNYWELTEELNNEELTAKQESNGNIIIDEFRGLKFKNGTIRIYDREKNNLCLIGNSTITFPTLKKDYIITIKGRAANGTPRITPGTSSTFLQDGSTGQTGGQCIFSSDSECTFKWTVPANSAQQFQLTNNDDGIYIYEASVEPYTGSTSNASAMRSTGSNLKFTIKSEDLHSESIRFK